MYDATRAAPPNVTLSLPTPPPIHYDKTEISTSDTWGDSNGFSSERGIAATANSIPPSRKRASSHNQLSTSQGGTRHALMNRLRDKWHTKQTQSANGDRFCRSILAGASAAKHNCAARIKISRVGSPRAVHPPPRAVHPPVRRLGS